MPQMGITERTRYVHLGMEYEVSVHLRVAAYRHYTYSVYI